MKNKKEILSYLFFGILTTAISVVSFQLFGFIFGDENEIGYNGLTKREKTVLYYRFGFDGNGPRTLEELGKIFGVTRERIRQIQTKAIRKLRNKASFNPAMREFVEAYYDKDLQSIKNDMRKSF